MKAVIIFTSSILIHFLILHNTSCESIPLNGFKYLKIFGNNERQNETIFSSVEEIEHEKEYDFIVIGGGSSGSVVANRLSEEKGWKVLLLEAGSHENFITDIPLAAGYLPLTEFNWGYSTEPQANACWAMNGRRCPWPRGKVLGGSSVINYMIYSRGSRRDYDTWADLGNPGWSYEQVLPYFLKSENNQVPELKSSKFHSSGGYLNVESVPFRTRLAQDFLDGAEELGYLLGDYNVEEQLAFSFVQATMRKGSRCSAAKAFLKPIQHRTNLHISLNTMVTKIIIDPNTKETRGVEFIKDNETHTINVRKEVILSAGVLNSPQLLMVSGVGPKEHLLELGIPVVQDSRVGQNLQDHATFYGLTFVLNDTVGLNTKRIESLPTIVKYIFNHTGPLTIPGGVEALGYLRTKYAQDERPDIELIFTSAGINNEPDQAYSTGFGISSTFYDTFYKPIRNVSAWTILPVLLLPKSRGSLKLKDDNPLSSPLIHANYFYHPQDVVTLVEGIKHAVRFADTLSLKNHGCQVYNTPIPGCEEFSFGSDSYWACAIRFLSYTIFHQTGTCKMGPATDPDAVVDAQLRVYGIQGLRVADASITPTIPTAHINAVAYMIGEKVSDLIKASWK